MNIIKGLSRLVFVLTLTNLFNLEITDLAWWELVVSFWVMKSFDDYTRIGGTK